MLHKTLFIFTLSFMFANSYAQSIKVFILAGQSNMEGFGQIEDETLNGTLEYFLAHDDADEFEYLTDIDDNFIIREDLWIRFDRNDEGLKTGELGVGFGAYDDFIGPEYGFGFQMADYFEEQVLIIKTAWGGKNLAVDFRPPSSGGTVGPYYTQIITDVNAAIENIATEFPEYAGETIEIAGFVWFQGWNDGEEDEYLLAYESNLNNLIQDIRNDLDEPTMKLVVANTGIGGFDLMEEDLWVYNLQTQLVPAQGNAAENEEHVNVALADTRSFWRTTEFSPEDALHHWNHNAESFLRIGNEMGLKMIELLEESAEITEENKNAFVHFFPNPATNQVSLNYSFGNSAITPIRLFDLAGKEIIAFTPESSSGSCQWNTSNLVPGLYIVSSNTKNWKLLIK